jgi:dCMP deaminase
MTNKRQCIIDKLSEINEESDDGNTQVSAIITDSENLIISYGTNRLPDGLDYKSDRCVKPLKYKWLMHAERSAIYMAAREGKSTNGCKMYVNYFPCVDCSRGIIQSGIKTLIAPKPDISHHKWGESWSIAIDMLEESGITIVYYV